MKFITWKQDDWRSPNGNILKYDKVEHFIRDFVICLLFGFFAAVVFNYIWECIDGTRPWEEGKQVEGFSPKDALAGLAGALCGLLIPGGCHGWLP